MSFRRVEVVLPAGHGGDPRSLMDPSVRVIDSYSGMHNDDWAYHIFLLDPDSVEPVIESLSNEFENVEGFRVAVHEIASLVPMPTADNVEHSGDPDCAEARRRADRIAREELLEVLSPGTQISPIFVSTVSLSSVIAAIGMIKDSAAVVIGAMMIAPLLLPNMSLALGTTLGDLKMVGKSLVSNSLGVALSLAIAVLIGWLVPFDVSVGELDGRTAVDLFDVALALAAGTAGAVAVSTGVSANLIGVMVAVALLPPLVALGLFAGLGDLERAGSALLLSAINVICVNLAAVATFLITGVRPNRWHDKDIAKKASLTALLLWIILLGVGITLVVLINNTN